MAVPVSNLSEFFNHIQWQWDSSAKPFSDSPVWRSYDDIEKIIIEKAFVAKESHATIDGYIVDLKRNLQISDTDPNRQRRVRRIELGKSDSHVREERFLFTPVSVKRPFGGLYGWVPPFIKAVANHFEIKRDSLPSKDKTKIAFLVEKAANGIILEGKIIGMKRKGEELAKILLQKKNEPMEEVWKCCAYLYSMDTFLYRRINVIMRLVGDDEQEEEWRSKISTLGPYCLLLWDNPIDDKSNVRGTVVYRGAELNKELIADFEKDVEKKDRPIRSFQAFTSCSRKRSVGNRFGNVLFIITIRHAFTIDLKQYSAYPEEEEELICPGACFIVDRVEYDKSTKKSLIYLNMVQQRRQNDIQQISATPLAIESNINELFARDDGIINDFREDEFLLQKRRETLDRLFRERLRRDGLSDDWN